MESQTASDMTLSKLKEIDFIDSVSQHINIGMQDGYIAPPLEKAVKML